MSDRPATLTVRSGQEYNPHASTSPTSSPPALLESERGGMVERAFFSSIRSVPPRSKCRRDGARERGEGQPSVLLPLDCLSWGHSHTYSYPKRNCRWSAARVVSQPREQLGGLCQGKVGGWYERKPWTTPLLIASCCLLGAIVVIVVAEELAISLR
jgi:hypothetical protein